MFKHIILFLIFTVGSCERSLTLVLDTTVSMEAEILEVRANIGQVLNSDRSQYSNLVLVPFNDSAVEPIFTTESVEDYLWHLNSLKTSGGEECPENSLAGIEAGLRASGKQSTIFVFTDGFAKDAYEFPAVERLCKETHSQVIIFLSGHCLPSQKSPVGNLQVYYDIARACSGAMLKWDSLVDLREAFRYMKEVIKTDWTNITAYETFTESKQISFSVDRFTSDLMLVVSGFSPVIDIVGSNLQRVRAKNVIRTRQPLVLLITPEVGEYTVNIRGQGPISITFYERSYLPFQFGFSTKSPRNLKETSGRPIGGHTNYILINVDDSVRLREVEWLNLGESVKQVLLLEQVSSGSYVSSVFVEQGKMFRFWIVGEDLINQREIRGASAILGPQTLVNENTFTWIQPKVEILDSDLGLVDYGSALTLAARIVAYPKPDIQWQDGSNDDDGSNLPSENILLEIPSVYISYVTIPNVSKNSTITCFARNDANTAESSIDVFVNRTFTFEVIQSPEDASVEFDSEHRLYCDVDAYPEATTKWYINGSIIDTTTNSRLTIEDDSLIIKNMGFEDIGTYECKASNDVESKSLKADIEITGVESPEIESTDTEVHFKPSEFSAEIKCKIAKGKPAPEIVWKYRSFSESEFTDSLPFGASSSSDKVNFNSVEKKLGGVYRCIATNAVGEATKDFNVKIVSSPVIKNTGFETLDVRTDDDVSLPCDVEATPEATVRWEMSQDDLIMPFDTRHFTDDKHTHHFKALPNDSGNYHCVAENSVGKAERTVVLNVLVPPYIEPQPEWFYANIGRSVMLPCNVSRGNPTPVIRWVFRPKDSTTSRELARKTSRSSLEIGVVSKNDEGAYTCIAENLYGADSIKYNLVVQ